MTQTDMSVVLVASGRFELIRRTLRHLAAQTVAARLEVILVAPDAASLAGCEPSETAPFGSVQRVFVGSISDVDKSAVAGVAVARSAIVALVEDHAYPEPEWADALLRAHARGSWAAVGSTVVNANPRSALSWANQLMAYGEWTEPVHGGETTNISRHNISFKRHVLDRYGDRLVEYMGRAGGLLQELQKRGYTFYLEPAARIHHANPSRFASTVRLRFLAGRLSGANKVRRGQFGTAKRVVYFLATPAIPMLRFRRISRKLFARENRSRAPKVVPTLLLALTLDGLGQMLGFGFGPGTTEGRLADFEMDRTRHLTRHDQSLLAD